MFDDEKRPLIVMILFALTMSFYIGLIAILDHIGLRTQLNDLGFVEQAVWNVTQGNLTMPSSNPVVFCSTLLVHVNPIFYLLAIPYFLFPTPITLLVIGSLAFGTTGIAMYLFANKILKSTTLALILGSAILINPLVQETALYDFHSLVLAMPLIILILLSMESKKWIPFWVCTALLMILKEDMPLLILFLSPIVFLRGSKKHGIAMAIVSIIYFVGIFSLLGHKYETEFTIDIISHRYSYLGNNIKEIAFNSIFEPQRWLRLFLEINNRPQYVIYLFLQGGFLAMLSPISLIAAIPNFAQNILSQAPHTTTLAGMYYTGVIITVIYSSCVYSLLKLNKLFLRALLAAFIIQTVVFSFVFSPTPYGLLNIWGDLMPTHNIKAFNDILSLIPDDASVAAQNNIGAHLAGRELIVSRTENFSKVDYMLLSVHLPIFRLQNRYFKNHGTLLGYGKEYFTEHVVKAFSNRDFGIISYHPPFYLFKRGHPRTLNRTAKLNVVRELEGISYCKDSTVAGIYDCEDRGI